MKTGELGRKEQEIMDFLHERIFDAILQSPLASEKLKQGVRYTIMRMGATRRHGHGPGLLVGDNRDRKKHRFRRAHAPGRIRAFRRNP